MCESNVFKGRKEMPRIEIGYISKSGKQKYLSGMSYSNIPKSVIDMMIKCEIAYRIEGETQ